MKKCIFILFLFTILDKALIAQVLINEISCANKSAHQDNYGQYEDWIELYNAGATAVNLSGYYLSDNKNIPTKWLIPSGVINPGAFRLFYASNKDIVSGNYSHTNFKLKQTGNEEVVLSNASGVIVDSVTIKPSQVNHSFGRQSNGGLAWGFFTNPTPNASNINAFVDYANKPIFTIVPGFYAGSQTIILVTNDPNCTIRYTTNGTDPTLSSTLYSGPFSITSTTLIKARCFSSNAAILPSFIESNTYFINNTHSLPVISLGGNYNSLFSSWGIRLASSFEYFDKNGVFQFEGFGEADKHGNDSWAFAQKGIDYVVRDEYGYNNEFEYQIFHSKSRQKFQRLILKAAGDDNYPGFGGESCHIRDAFIHSLGQRAGMQLDHRTSESCVLYINGQYWGIYEIREKTMDPDYTDYYYGQKEEYLDWLSFWGSLTVRYGSASDWNDLYNYITTNSMANQANYNQAANRIDISSVIDHMIINTWAINSNWINWNSAWWRGNAAPIVKWKYANWDMANTFNLGQNFSGWTTTTYIADPCDLTTSFSNAGPNMGHFDIFNALMDNTGFKNMFINRYNTLTQSYLNCAYAIPFLDSMIANIAPEMPAHIARWGGSLSAWQNNVQLMKNQINGRCSVITQGIQDCYGVVNGEIETVNNNIMVSPNPSDGLVYITSFNKIKEINIFDLSGREIPINPSFITDTRTSVSLINKGVYIIKISDNKHEVNIQKLIIH